MPRSAEGGGGQRPGRSYGRTAGIALAVVAAGSLAADVFIAHHGAPGIAGTVGFHAWFGVVSCLVFAAGAWLLGIVLGRTDDYYDR